MAEFDQHTNLSHVHGIVCGFGFHVSRCPNHYQLSQWWCLFGNLEHQEGFRFPGRLHSVRHDGLWPHMESLSTDDHSVASPASKSLMTMRSPIMAMPTLAVQSASPCSRRTSHQPITGATLCRRTSQISTNWFMITILRPRRSFCWQQLLRVLTLVRYAQTPREKTARKVGSLWSFASFLICCDNSSNIQYSSAFVRMSSFRTRARSPTSRRPWDAQR